MGRMTGPGGAAEDDVRAPAPDPDALWRALLDRGLFPQALAELEARRARQADPQGVRRERAELFERWADLVRAADPEAARIYRGNAVRDLEWEVAHGAEPEAARAALEQLRARIGVEPAAPPDPAPAGSEATLAPELPPTPAPADELDWRRLAAKGHWLEAVGALEELGSRGLGEPDHFLQLARLNERLADSVPESYPQARAGRYATALELIGRSLAEGEPVGPGAEAPRIFQARLRAKLAAVEAPRSVRDWRALARAGRFDEAERLVMAEAAAGPRRRRPPWLVLRIVGRCRARGQSRLRPSPLRPRRLSLRSPCRGRHQRWRGHGAHVGCHARGEEARGARSRILSLAPIALAAGAAVRSAFLRTRPTGDRHFKWPSVTSPPPSARLPQRSILCGAYFTLRARGARKADSCTRARRWARARRPRWRPKTEARATARAGAAWGAASRASPTLRRR